MTKKELMAKLKAVAPESKYQRNQIICSLIGHSNIVEGCFGYVHCARCEAQLGDTLAGCYTNEHAAIVGHDCETCRENYAKMGWRDKLYCPNPITKNPEEATT